MVFDQAQFLQRQLHQPPIHRMEIRARVEGVAQLVGRRPQALVRQCGQRRRIRFAVSDCLQHAACAGAQQIGHDTRDLDVGFFEERLQSVVELDAAARDLVLAAHHGPPEPLLGVGHKAQGEFLGDQPLHQTFRIRKVLLAPAGAAIRLRLCKVERPGEQGAHRARPALRSPVPLQRLPHRPPILRGRLHHHFLDLALDEPLSKRAQLDGAGPDLEPFEMVVTLDLDVSHRDGQHLLVHVDSRDLVRHRPLLVGAESVPRRINQGRELSPRREHGDAQLFGQSRTLRIKQLLGFDCSMANLDLAAPSPPFCPTYDFHVLSRASRPSRNQLRKSSRTPSQIGALSAATHHEARPRIRRLSRRSPEGAEADFIARFHQHASFVSVARFARRRS